MQKLWALKGLELTAQKKESSKIKCTYVPTLHILSMNIVVLTFVINLVYHQTLTFSNRSHMLKKLCIGIQGLRSKP